MPDFGHELQFGTFLTPGNSPGAQPVRLAQFSERVGLDLVTFQDHPYQPRFHDTWTLLTYVGASTGRIRLSANVMNLPLRGPVVIARSVASLDRLTGGRVELGLGAGAFWEAIEASGGRKLSPGQAVDALGEAIDVIREVWAAYRPGGVRVDGEFYRVVGAKRGPAPAHDVEIWLGAGKPRMLRLTGRAADGWVLTLGRLPGGPSDLIGLGALVDAGAVAAGRQPGDVRRLLNISGTFSAKRTGFLEGPAAAWADDLTGLALEHGTSVFILASDDATSIVRFADEVAPHVRELVAAERSRAGVVGHVR